MECFLVALDNGDTWAFDSEDKALKATEDSPFEYKIFYAQLSLVASGFGDFYCFKD